jgi:type IV pilus assembly protein PilA
MRKILNKKSGFTLIELMIVVAILGILAAIAIPAFVQYVRRSKSAEAVTNVDQMFKLASSYYNPTEKQTGSGIDQTQNVFCTVGTGTDLKTPIATKTLGTYDDNTPFGPTGLNFSVGFGYYGYGLTNTVGAACNGAPAVTDRYKLQAIGDLDGDSVYSLFEQAVATNANNELYRARGFYINNETE